MAEELVIPTPVASSVTKFSRLITEALTVGPKKSKDIYQIVLNQQPLDCPNTPCPHRKKASKSLEWQHEVQRQLARLAKHVEGLWHLKNMLPASPVPAVLPEVKIETIEPVVEVVPVEAAPVYTGDPFIVTEDGHFMDEGEYKKPPEKRFLVPMNFDEFYFWKQDYVINWVKKRLNRYQVDDEVEDWTQDLLIHLRYLPQGSKHRLPGANGRPNGCQDVIETFDPIHQYGASERRFRNYINGILANKFLTVQSKHQKNPVCRSGNVTFGSEPDEWSEYATGDEFVHANSEFLSNHTMRIAKQHDDRLYTNEFKQFVANADPIMSAALEALEATGTIGEAAKFMGVSEGEFARYRNRLKQLGECFEEGIPAPKQRRPYRKRTKTEHQFDQIQRKEIND